MEPLRKAALTTGVSNGLINGVLTWLSLRSAESVPISLDSVRFGSGTVLGRLVGSAFVLGLLLTLLTFSATRRKATPHDSPLAALRTNASITTFTRTALRHAIFAFGALMIVAVLWQRFVGTVLVSRLGASLVTAMLAGATATTIAYFTLVEMLRRAQLEQSGRSVDVRTHPQPAAS